MTTRLQTLVKMTETASRRIFDIPAECRKLGLPAAIRMYASWLLHPPYLTGRKAAPRRLGKVELRGYPHPFHFRHGTSDVLVMRQMFVKEQYEIVGNERDVRFIVDCGANIGGSAFYFLSKYPQANVIAIEPDEGNFEILKKNLEPFGDRAHVLQSAVWSSDQKLRIERGQFGDGKEWSFQVRVCQPGEEADVSALGVKSILDKFAWDRVDLLKIDIEGSEVEVFSSEPDSWLARTQTITIELHGPKCDEAVLKAMSKYDCQIEQSGELTIFRNIRRQRDGAKSKPARALGVDDEHEG